MPHNHKTQPRSDFDRAAIARMAVARLKETFNAQNDNQKQEFKTLTKLLPMLAIHLKESGEKVDPATIDGYIMGGAEEIEKKLKTLTPKKYNANPMLTYDGVIKELEKNDPWKRVLQAGTATTKMMDNARPDWRANKNVIGQVAARNGHFPLVKFLSRQDTDINLLLGAAAEKGQLEIVKYLHKNGADITAYDNYAARMAASEGRLHTLKYLHKHGADLTASHYSALKHASTNGHLDLVKYLYEHNANPPENYLLDLNRIAQNGDTEMLKFLHHQGQNIGFYQNTIITNAVKSGSLEMVKYVHQEHNAKTTADHNYAIRYAAGKGDLEMVKYLHENGADIVISNGTITNGHLDVLKYLHENGADITANNHAALRAAIKENHLAIVKYLYENTPDIPNIHDDLLAHAISEGQMYIVKYLHKDNPDLRSFEPKYLVSIVRKGALDVLQYLEENEYDLSQKQETTLEICSAQGRLDILKCLQKGGADLREHSTIIIENALLNSRFNILHELEKQNIDLFKNAPAPTAQRIETGLKNHKLWSKRYKDKAPQHITHLDPNGISLKTLNAVSKMIGTEGYQDKSAQRYAYNLCKLFKTNDRILRYLQKWGQHGKQPLHNLAQHIVVPQTGNPDMKAWGDAVLRFGPEMAKLVKFSDKHPKPYGSLNETRTEIAKTAYERSAEHPELSQLCFSKFVTEKHFDEALDLWKDQKARGFEGGQNIPDITIDGKEFGMDGAQFRKLPAGDIRGLFLGELVDCCQSLGSNGENCAKHGFMSPNGGFYVVETASGEIIGETWAWRGLKGELVFDSLETLGKRVTEEQWQALLKKFSKELENNNDKNVTALHVGTGGATPKFKDFVKSAKPAMAPDYKGYTDAREQYKVAQFSGLTITPAKIKDIPALLKIEHSAFNSPWYDSQTVLNAKDFKDFITNNNGPGRDQDVIVLAERNGKVVGYTAIEFYPEDPGVPKGSANLYSTAVIPDKTGQSLGRFRIARKLVEAAEEIVKKSHDHNALHLETHQNNRVVIQSLTRYGGYKVFGEYKSYFKDGGNAVRLRKIFSQAGQAPGFHIRQQDNNRRPNRGPQL